MRKWLRLARGTIGMGLTWAAAWSLVGMMPRWVLGFNADVPFPLVLGVLGFVAGLTFSGLIALAEGRGTVDRISLARVAGWGAIGGVLLSAGFARAASLDRPDVLVIVPLFALASAVCAAGSLAIARRAPLGVGH